MRKLVWSLALVCLAACAAEAGTEDQGDDSSRSDGEAGDGWWVEVEAAGMEIPRLQGGIVVASVAAGRTSNVRGNASPLRSTGSLSLVLPDFPGDTGTLTEQAATIWHQGETPHTCRSRELTVEVESVDPFQANFEGTGECWEGEDVAPEDPANPGERMAGVAATIRGSIVE